MTEFKITFRICLMKVPKKFCFVVSMCTLLNSIGVRSLSTSFSNSFDMIGNKEMGLYEETSFTGFPGFGTIITSAAFHWVGTYFSLRAAF